MTYVLLSAWALLASCESGPAAAQPDHVGRDSTGQYSVRFEVAEFRGAYTLAANGFPVERPPFRIDGRPGQEFAGFLTPALVSGRNVAAVEVVPDVSGGAVGPLRFRMWVEGPDGSVVPGTERGAAHVDSVVAAWASDLRGRWAGWGPSAADSARAWAEAHPVRVETAWVRPGGGRPSDGQPSFDAVFRDAPAIGGTAADSARLRAYAVRLGRLLAAAATDTSAAAALYDEFGPAVSDETGWYRVTADGTRAGAVAEVAGEWSGHFQSDFGSAEVGLRSWAGGRVWEVYRTDAPPGGEEALFVAKESLGGAWVRVYVGEVDGQLRVVRMGP